MKKRELLITAGILLAAVLLWFGIRLASPCSSASIRITVDGEEFGVFSLSKDCTIPIGDTNVCEQGTHGKRRLPGSALRAPGLHR